jgi:hypothetical protein
MIKLLTICVLAFCVTAIAGQQAAPTFLPNYLTPAQLTLVTTLFKKGHKRSAIANLQRHIHRLPKAKQDEFNRDFRAWVEAKAASADSPVTADLSFLTNEQRDSINRKILNCDKLTAVRELREYIDKLPETRRNSVLNAFRGTLPNLDFLTPHQWQAIQEKNFAGDEAGAKQLLAQYISVLPVDQQEKAVQELLKAQKGTKTDLCALNEDQRKQVLTKLSAGDKDGAKRSLDQFTALNEASRKAAVG